MPSPHTSRGSQWNKTRLMILERDNYTCAYCGREATEVDHILAKANGGTDEPSNLVAACKPCNGLKSDKPLVRTNWLNKTYLSRL